MLRCRWIVSGFRKDYPHVSTYAVARKCAAARLSAYTPNHRMTSRHSITILVDANVAKSTNVSSLLMRPRSIARGGVLWCNFAATLRRGPAAACPASVPKCQSGWVAVRAGVRALGDFMIRTLLAAVWLYFAGVIVFAMLMAAVGAIMGAGFALMGRVIYWLVQGDWINSFCDLTAMVAAMPRQPVLADAYGCYPLNTSFKGFNRLAEWSFKSLDLSLLFLFVGAMLLGLTLILLFVVRGLIGLGEINKGNFTIGARRWSRRPGLPITTGTELNRPEVGHHRHASGRPQGREKRRDTPEK